MSKGNIITLVVIFVLISAAGFAAFGPGVTPGGSGTPTVSESLQPKGELPYRDLNGNPVDLAMYEGSVLVINAWASWCPFCVNELPDFEEVAEEFKDKGVTVIAINRAESAATAQAFIAHVGNPDDLVFLLDPDDTFYKSIGGFAMPETVFYNAEGSVVLHKRGFMGADEIRRHIETALSTSLETP